MPYVNVRVAGGLSVEKRAELAQRITTEVEDVTGKSKQSIHVVIEEVPRDAWAVGGELLSERDKAS